MAETLPFLFEPSWLEQLEHELQKTYMWELAAFLKKERMTGKQIFPQEDLIFNAFTQTPFNKVQVVIMGQDPYHGRGQAHGLSFSVPQGIALPPSLQNIYKELHSNLGIPPANHGTLLSWAKQGVLLLNATLTVEEQKPLSHHNRGWERFTDVVIEKIANRQEPVIFVLWGKNAQEKCKNVGALKNNPQHLILQAPHPSPFSAYSGFFGSRPFSKINEQLEKWGRTAIDWKVA